MFSRSSSKHFDTPNHDAQPEVVNETNDADLNVYYQYQKSK